MKLCPLITSVPELKEVLNKRNEVHNLFWTERKECKLSEEEWKKWATIWREEEELCDRLINMVAAKICHAVYEYGHEKSPQVKFDFDRNVAIVTVGTMQYYREKESNRVKIEYPLDKVFNP